MRSLYTAAVFWAALCSSAAVRNESELSEALARISSSTGGGGDIIEFQDNIFLTETVDVTETLTMNGNSFYLDGNNGVRCLSITTSGITVTIYDLRVTDCSSSSDGAGIYVSDATLIMSNCSITNNELLDRLSGGGLAVVDSGSARLSDCTINNNGAASQGNYGGAAYFGLGSTAVFTRCTISNSYNTKYGGAIAVVGATVTFSMCSFSGNVAYAGFVAYGDSIYVAEDGSDGTDGSVTLSACALATDQSVYVQTGGSIVHHSGCPANTSVAGSVDLSDTVECTDSSSTWCPSSVLVADLRTNATCSNCGSGKISCCGSTTCETSIGVCRSDFCPAPAPTPSPTALPPLPSSLPTMLPTVAPTAADQSAVSLALTLSASAPKPSDNSLVILRKAIANEAGVPETSGIKDFSYSTSDERRRVTTTNNVNTYSWSVSCEVTFALADKVPLSFPSSAEYAKSLGAVLGSNSFSAYVESSIPNVTGITSVTFLVLSDVTNTPTQSLISSVTGAPTTAPSPTLQKEVEVMLAPLISIAGALFFAGLLIGYASGTLLSKTPANPENEKNKYDTIKAQQKNRPRDEKVLTLERPPEMHGEETSKPATIIQKKELPNKKKPSQTDNILIQSNVLEGESITRPSLVEPTSTINENKNKSNAMDLKKFGQLIPSGYKKEKDLNGESMK